MYFINLRIEQIEKEKNRRSIFLNQTIDELNFQLTAAKKVTESNMIGEFEEKIEQLKERYLSIFVFLLVRNYLIKYFTIMAEDFNIWIQSPLMIFGTIFLIRTHKNFNNNKLNNFL